MNMKKIKKFFTMSRRADGFTLVELIVVIAILAILGGVALPAYNGYTEKAKRAGDEQLLAAINKAYAAACLQNGYDMVDAPANGGANMPLDANKAVDLANVGPEKVKEAFAMFYAGNENSKFQVFAAIVYSPSEGRFMDVDSAPDMLVGGYLVDGPTLQAFKNSTLGQEGAEELLNMVAGVSGALGNGFGDEALLAALGSDAYQDAALALLGVEDMTYEEYLSAKEAEAYEQYLRDNDIDLEKLNREEKNAAKKAAEEYAAQKKADMEKNMLILVGASKAEEVNNDDFLDLMQSGNAYDTLNNTVKGKDGADSAMGTAESALAYSLYASYCAQAGKDPDPIEFKNALKGNDEGFNEYLNSDQAKTDLEGAKGAMTMIGDQDAETLENTAESGLGNQQLTDAMTQILG